VASAKSQDFSAGVQKINREFQEKATLNRAHEAGMSYIDIAKTPLNHDFLKIVEFETAKKARLVPFFKVGKKIRLAVEDSQNPETKAVIEYLLSQGHEVDISIASPSGIDEALDFYAKTQSKYKKIEFIKDVEKSSIATYEKEIAALKDLGYKLGEMTAEEALNLLNITAMKTGASDIHYEPEEKMVVVRFRIDGVLHKGFEMRHEVYKNISKQIKYESKMQLNVATIPQDGRYAFMFNENKIGVRVSSIPTPYGESFVCRFLVTESAIIGFEDLGFQGVSLKKLEKVCKISHGMVLATGPTGSGKSTTLYALINKMNTPENKIITLEDPVEYPIAGVTQSQIDEKRGYTFGSGLRSLLRQDPDVAMIGEVRDLETAQTAAQAALTGHVVLSTLHTNSAIETIPRLINMGLPPFMVAPSLDTIIAQRLVRKVCKECSAMEELSASEKKEFEFTMGNLQKINPDVAVEVPEKIARIKGCDACSQTGYSGRLVLAEVITIGSEMKRLILNKASLVDLISEARKEGMITMREDGFLKVAQGLTTLEEVFRVTNVAGA
jgi:type IV pilus assembly protein PilB